MSSLVDDRTISFLLYDVFDAEALTKLPHYSAHTREGFDLTLQTTAKLAREVLHPALKKLDREEPKFEDGRIKTHADLKRLYGQLVDAGFLVMPRPESVGGMQYPMLVSMAAHMY